MKVRTNGGKNQSMSRNNDHSRFQLDITQLAINSHSIHCWESINRMALQDRECYNPLSLLPPGSPCVYGGAVWGGPRGCRACPRPPSPRSPRGRSPARSGSAGTSPGCWCWHYCHIISKLCHFVDKQKVVSIIDGGTSHIHTSVSVTCPQILRVMSDDLPFSPLAHLRPSDHWHTGPWPGWLSSPHWHEPAEAQPPDPGPTLRPLSSCPLCSDHRHGPEPEPGRCEDKLGHTDFTVREEPTGQK